MRGPDEEPEVEESPAPEMPEPVRIVPPSSADEAEALWYW